MRMPREAAPGRAPRGGPAAGGVRGGPGARGPGRAPSAAGPRGVPPRARGATRASVAPAWPRSGWPWSSVGAPAGPRRTPRGRAGRGPGARGAPRGRRGRDRRRPGRLRGLPCAARRAQRGSPRRPPAPTRPRAPRSGPRQARLLGGLPGARGGGAPPPRRAGLAHVPEHAARRCPAGQAGGLARKRREDRAPRGHGDGAHAAAWPRAAARAGQPRGTWGTCAVTVPWHRPPLRVDGGDAKSTA